MKTGWLRYCNKAVDLSSGMTIILAIMLIMQSCQKADVGPATRLNCPIEEDPVYRENPKISLLFPLPFLRLKFGRDLLYYLRSDSLNFAEHIGVGNAFPKSPQPPFRKRGAKGGMIHVYPCSPVSR